MSFRATRILQGVHLILAEDTRHTRKLLKHFAIRTPGMILRNYASQPGKSVTFSCIMPVEFYPATQLGYKACILSNYNMVVQATDTNRPSTHPPEIWWDMPLEARVTLGRMWFSAHVDTSDDLPVYDVRNDNYFDRLVKGCKVMPGRWFVDVGLEDLLQLLSERSISAATVRRSDCLTLEQALQQHMYSPDWQCSECGGYMVRFGDTGLCRSCYLKDRQYNLATRLNG